MKNKTKKILASACLGIASMGCLTGCAGDVFTEEQVEKIESLIETGDTYMKDSIDVMEGMKDSNASFQEELIEEIKKQDNTQLQEELLAELKKQNSKVDRAEAAMLVNYATNKLLINSGDIWANMQMNINISDYDNVVMKGTLKSFKDSEGRYIFYLNEEDEFFNACWAGGLFEPLEHIDLPEPTAVPLLSVPETYIDLMRRYLTDEYSYFSQLYYYEENIVSAKINGDGNYEIVGMFDNTYYDAIDYVTLISTTIIDQEGNLVSVRLEELVDSTMIDGDSRINYTYTFTYGELEEESVYELLGVTSDDLVYPID